jgi:AcrR family transcriptional regulator
MARPASDIRARLLVAARKRFLADGADGASLRTIAKDARTNVGMVVYWFATKDELFMAVVEDVYARLLADMDAILEPGARGPHVRPVRERLERAFARLGNASEEELDTIRLVIREALLTPPSPRFVRLVARFQQGHLAMIARVLQEGVERGELDESIPLPLLLVATFGMGGAPQILRRIAGAAVPFAALPGAEALGASAAQLLFHGIAAKPSPGRPKKKTRRPQSG